MEELNFATSELAYHALRRYSEVGANTRGNITLPPSFLRSSAYRDNRMLSHLGKAVFVQGIACSSPSRSEVATDKSPELSSIVK